MKSGCANEDFETDLAWPSTGGTWGDFYAGCAGIRMAGSG